MPTALLNTNMPALTPPSEETLHVTFCEEGEFYALALEDVEEIFEYETLRKVPKVPGLILGLVDLRGEIITVLSLLPNASSEPRIALALRPPFNNLAVHLPYDLDITKLEAQASTEDIISGSDFQASEYGWIESVQRSGQSVYNIISAQSIKEHAMNVLVESFKASEVAGKQSS